MPSTISIILENDQLNEYSGAYDYPDYAAEGYTIQKQDDYLLTADNKKLICVGVDQFIEEGHKADNIVYMFTRDENGAIAQLRMQGCGGPYFEIRCDKKIEQVRL